MIPKLMVLACLRISGVTSCCGNVVHLRSGLSVNIPIGVKSLKQVLILTEVSKNAQFDLGVISGKEQMSRRGNERFADFSSFLGTNGNVLKIGFRAAERPVAVTV